MAISATFQADFTQFVGEVNRADVKLRSFEDNSHKVGTALTRMTDGFSGTKIIQDATLMVSAVERIGGVSKLTEAELKRVSATASEAAAKMKAMGVEVPPGIQKIADETRNADTATGSLMGTVKSLALGFAALFTARAAFNFAKDVIADASALKDLSQQTHIGVEDLQILAGAMSEFGVDADTLGKGLFTLSRKIARGDDSVTDAIGQMGMSLKEVQGLNGRELFLKIMDGLATLQGGLRDDTSSELFGSRLGMAMGGASEDIRAAIDVWLRLNHVASTESVDAMDQYDEAIKRASKSLGAMAANMIGPVAEGFNVIANAAQTGAGKWDLFVAMTKDWASSNSVTGASTKHLAALLDELNQKTTASAAATKVATEANDKHVPSAQAMTKETRLAAEAAEKLAAAWTKANATAYRKFLNEIGVQEIQDHAEVLKEKEKMDAAYRKFLNEIGVQELEDAKTMWDSVKEYSNSSLQATADKAKAAYDYVAARAEEFAPKVIEQFRLAAEAAAATAGEIHGIGNALAGLTLIGEKAKSSLTKDKPSGVTVFDGAIGGAELSAYGASLKTAFHPGLRMNDVMSPFGANGSVVNNVTVNAQGGFYDNPESVQKLARKVGDAITAGWRSQGRQVT